MNNKLFWSFLSLTTLVYAMGLSVNVMDVDASQYASMSREMMVSGSYLQVYEHGKDYLDKPPLVFWLSALSMKILGVSNFAYKLPSFLFALLAVFSTYRFTQLFYNKIISQLAALVLATSQAMFLITNDCRTDTLLMGCVAFTIWQLAAAFLSNKRLYFLGAFIGIGFGMLAKGPVALIIPGLAFSAHFLIKKEFKNFFRVEYLWGLLVIALILTPMCIGLYQQFDLHPEKVVNGKTGTSGLRFFFWTQSFGRITGENVWRNNVYFTYLFECMLWSFIPWIIYLMGGIVHSIIKAFKNTQSIENKEFISIGGLILGYIILATSKYQLPHYIFVVYPLAAVVTARFLHFLIYEKPNWIGSKLINGFQWFLLFILWALPFLLMSYTFPTIGMWLYLIGSLFIAFLVLSLTKKQIVFSTAATVLAVNAFLSLYFYPKLLTFQEGSEIGLYVKEQNVPNDKFFAYKWETGSSLQFYSQRIVELKDSMQQVRLGDWLLTDRKGLDELLQGNWQVINKKMFRKFNVSNLTPRFLNEATRDSSLTPCFLVEIVPH